MRGLNDEVACTCRAGACDFVLHSGAMPGIRTLRPLLILSLQAAATCGSLACATNTSGVQSMDSDVSPSAARTSADESAATGVKDPGNVAEESTGNAPTAAETDGPANESPEVVQESSASANTGRRADATDVQVTGSEGAYTFSVTVQSPDTGCQRYADWWEVVSAEGELLYRRVLLHSHVTEQPFTRSGGPVDISAEQEVWIRAHMHPEGYGGTSQFGSVARGFQVVEPRLDDAVLAKMEPLPSDCAF